MRAAVSGGRLLGNTRRRGDAVSPIDATACRKPEIGIVGVSKRGWNAGEIRDCPIIRQCLTGALAICLPPAVSFGKRRQEGC